MSLMTARVLVLNLVVDLLLWLQPTIGCTAQSVFQRASLLCGSQKKKSGFLNLFLAYLWKAITHSLGRPLMCMGYEGFECMRNCATERSNCCTKH